MPLQLSLQDVVSELALASRKRRMGVDLRTGAFVSLTDGVRATGASGEATSELVAARLETGELLPLPSVQTIGLPAVARRFAAAQEDPDRRDALLWSLRGRGGLHCFQDTLRRLDGMDTWVQERDRHLADLAVHWLERHQLSYSRDLAPWGRLRRLS
jgi:hypothetical protein